MAKTTDYKPALGLNVVAVRLVKEPKLFPKKLINCSDDAVDCVRNLLATYDREVFCAINLCSDSSVINFHVISQGTLNATLIAPREVFKSSILSNAAGVIFLHNHPSGNPKPSSDDYVITKRLVECGKLLDIKVVDHIIVGGATGYYYSFAVNDELDD